MEVRAALLIALSLLGAALAVTVPPAAPAWACSCVGGDVDGRADLIVVGTVRKVTDRSIRPTVEAVEKGTGTAGTTLRLQVGRDEASCGYAFRTGARYRVNSRQGSTGLCDGIRPMPAAPAAVGSSVTTTPVAAGPEPPESSRRSQIGIGATLAALAVGLVTVALRRRRTG